MIVKRMQQQKMANWRFILRCVSKRERERERERETQQKKRFFKMKKNYTNDDNSNNKIRIQ